MKRLVSLLLVIISVSASAQSQKISTEWLFAYYMPYDNNLSSLSDTIVTMIQRGIKTKSVLVTIQSDTEGSGGMKRLIITSDTIITSSVDTDFSSHTSTYAEYLTWITQNIVHKKRALIFLNHGGKLDEIGLDSYPKEKFLRVDSVSELIRKFNKVTRHTTDLLFLQVCTKGSIEPLYELRDCAKFTMASQAELGAPNFYYTSFFEALSKSSTMEITDIAKSIMKQESADMYNSLTCIDNSSFPEFGKKFRALIESISSNTTAEFQRDERYVLHYYNQTYYDLIAFLQGLQLKEKKQAALRDDLIAFIKAKLIVLHQVEPSKKLLFENYCGVSLFMMSRGYPEKNAAYQHMSFFREFDMNRVYHAVYMKGDKL